MPEAFLSEAAPLSPLDGGVEPRPSAGGVKTKAGAACKEAKPGQAEGGALAEPLALGFRRAVAGFDGPTWGEA
jgi:hypothetical protein